MIDRFFYFCYSKTMPIATRNSTRELKELEAEVIALRSFVIGFAGRDPEGNYRPEFVERILKGAREESVGTFVSARSFLAALE